MSVNKVDALVQFTNDAGSEWEVTSIVPQDFLVYDTTNNIIKKGNGSQTIENLPVWLDLNVLEDIYNNVKDKIDPLIFDEENINKLAIITTDGKISITDINKDDFETWINTILSLNTEEGINESPLITSNILPPYINAPNQSYIGSIMTLEAYSISLFGDTSQLTYEWTLPDSSTIQSQSISYTIDDDSSLINTELVFKCKAISKTGFSSLESEFKLTVKGSSVDKSPCIRNTRLTKQFV